MSQVSTVGSGQGSGRISPILFQSLTLAGPSQRAGRKSATFLVSFALHLVLALAMVLLPLIYYNAMPGQEALKAFFATPLELAPPAPPPPPPPAGQVVRVPKIAQPQAFVAPVDVSNVIRPEETLELGDESAANIEGAVPGSVIGGVVAPVAAPTPPPRVVRVGGQLAAPKIIKRVDPVYPELARSSRVAAIVILEAEVDTRGQVKTAKILRGHPLFDAAAIEAVQQWRYQPLLLNGEPTGFILTVTINFNLQQ
jgi:protein TonB